MWSTFVLGLTSIAFCLMLFRRGCQYDALAVELEAACDDLKIAEEDRDQCLVRYKEHGTLLVSVRKELAVAYEERDEALESHFTSKAKLEATNEQIVAAIMILNERTTEPDRSIPDPDRAGPIMVDAPPVIHTPFTWPPGENWKSPLLR